MIYYLPFFLILFLSSLSETWGIKHKHREWLLVFVTMFSIIFTGLRFHTGSDWNNYMTHFMQTASMGNTFGFESGYYFFSKFLFLNTENYYLLQLLASCFILISAMCFFRKHSKYPIFVFTLFILVSFDVLMAQMRQAIAIGFILISAQYIFERKFLLFLLMIFLACQFHISAIIALPLYFFNKNYGKIIPIVLIIVSQIFAQYPDFTVSLIRVLSPYMPGRFSVISERYLSGAASYIQQQKIQTGVFYISRILLTIFIIIVVTPKNNKETFFINALAAATCIKCFAANMGILERFVCYYLIFGIMAYALLLPFQIKWFRLKPIVIAFLIISFFAFPFWRVITSNEISELTGRPNSYRYIPYYNVLYHSDEASQRKDWNE
ncbi:MAG: EpsG family protein [Bacteroidales bacterium]|jgi:hypothetical protein|nr:EpsG family protein [Bacteroidales bacterium]